MKVGLIFTVLKKEILDIVRDRRTLIFMILLPLLLMPALIALMQHFIISGERNIAARPSTIAIIGEEAAPGLATFLKTQQREQFEPPVDTNFNEFIIERQSEVNAFINIDESITDEESALAAMREKDLDAYIVIPEGFQSKLVSQNQPPTEADDVNYDDQPQLRIEHISTIKNSEKAQSRLQRSMNYYSDELVKQRMETAGLPASFIDPITINTVDQATAQEKSGEILGSLLPYLIILVTFGGATFPAIQLGAGEKEQKTLETLLVSPIGRVEMVTGKFLTIVVTAMISAILSLIGMYYAFNFMGQSNGLSELLKLQMDVTSMVMAAVLIIPMTLVFAAILLMISVYAKNYREAQSYMAPLQFGVILPAFASFLPGVELNTTLSMIPIVNVSLVLRQILSGKAMEVLPYFAITIISTLVLAAIVIFFCAQMFKNEKAIFNN